MNHRYEWHYLLSVIIISVIHFSEYFNAACVADSGSTQIVVMEGDPLPDGTGTFDFFGDVWYFPVQSGRTFSEPTLNDAGQAAFIANTASSNGALDIYRGGDGSLTPIVRTGQSAPDGNGVFSHIPETSYVNTMINDQNQVLFRAWLSGTANGALDSTGLFLGDGLSLIQVVREGDAAPGGGAFGEFTRTAATNAALNDSGLVAFFATVSSGSGLFTGDGSTITSIFKAFDVVPDGNGLFNPVSPNVINYPPSLSNLGHVAFYSSLQNTSGGSDDDSGLYHWDGSVLAQIVREGQPAPDSNGIFGSLIPEHPLVNDAGHTAFAAGFLNTLGGVSDDSGIMQFDGVSLSTLIREGQAAPDGNGVVSQVGGLAGFNDAGHALFYGELSGTDGGVDDGGGYFLGDSDSLTRVVKIGQPSPDGVGTIERINRITLNDKGQVLFSAEMSNTEWAFFLYDEQLGILTIARENAPFLGSSFGNMDWMLSGASNDEQSGLNNLGQVTYQFNLQDGREGVAIWSPPVIGDLDGDGFVGINDLTLVLGHWNQIVPPADPLADPSGDGFIGIDDLNRVLANWNAGTPPRSQTSIPETGTMVVLSLGVLGVLSHRRDHTPHS